MWHIKLTIEYDRFKTKTFISLSFNWNKIGVD